MTWLALAVLMCAPAGESMTATLVEGPVTVAGAPIATGAVLQPGDTVETQVGGRAEIALPGGSLLRIGENTRLTLSPVPARSEFSARLFFGNLWARVHKLASGETFRVETENGVAGVRGTEFRVDVGQQQPDLVRVYEGTVLVEARDGRWWHALQRDVRIRSAAERHRPIAFEVVTRNRRERAGARIAERVRRPLALLQENVQVHRSRRRTRSRVRCSCSGLRISARRMRPGSTPSAVFRERTHSMNK